MKKIIGALFAVYVLNAAAFTGDGSERVENVPNQLTEFDREIEIAPNARPLMGMWRGCPVIYRLFETPPCGFFANDGDYEEALAQWEESLPLYFRIKWELGQALDAWEMRQLLEEFESLPELKEEEQ
jgi:hypothetical protein